MPSVSYLLSEMFLKYQAMYSNGTGSGIVSVINLAGFGRHLMIYLLMYLYL